MPGDQIPWELGVAFGDLWFYIDATVASVDRKAEALTSLNVLFDAAHSNSEAA